jgi:glycosyltransferase involved in cell wall biosynthesis
MSLEKEISFVGEVKGEEKWSLYQKSDIFCLPSYHESFGLVLIEAMMCGIPVIATNWGASEEIITKDVGFICDSYESIELGEKLKTLITNEDLRISMGYKGRKKYLDEYSEETFFLNMQNAFNFIN